MHKQCCAVQAVYIMCMICVCKDLGEHAQAVLRCACCMYNVYDLCVCEDLGEHAQAVLRCAGCMYNVHDLCV